MTGCVLMLSAAHPPDDIRIVAKEGAALAAAGHRVIHLAPGDPPAPVLHGVALHSHGPKRRGWRGRVLGIAALARAAAAQRPAVIHAHEPDSWAAARLAAWRCGARMVLDVHEHYPSRLDPRLPRALRPLGRAALTALCRLLALGADAVVVAKDGLDDAFGGEARCTRVRNYAGDPGIPPRIHAPGPLRLLHLGALGASRGAFTMLDALALLPADARLVLVGRFTDGSEAAFDARAAALDVAHRIEKHGWLPREAALAEAARCDIALVLFQPGVENHRLALPHKLFDAMLLGLPVIVPDFAEEVLDVVAAAGCGLAVDTADARAVAEAALRLRDPALRAELGACGRAAALTRFGWPAEAARLVALYARLLPGGATASPRPSSLPHPAGAAASDGG
ncbi:glycosyltransferase [Roseomonas sp. AR75]|uniref:glycosyltransferase n=1 Tax=Roseomonas sp. AR75 TaxID=2562311 RepID=UPI0010C0ABE1|nr:glycosyltransferase [Roseomonas sp. AR75]